MAPSTWATMYDRHSFRREAASAQSPTVIAGLKWAPEMCPTA